MSSEKTTYTVGEVAKIAHVSVRTLHHYDEIGLLDPSDRSEAGYRLYSADDLEKLQSVLFFKELGFELEEIDELLSAPGFDRRESLLMQRELIAGEALRHEAMLDLIDRTLASAETGIRMTKEEMFEVFGEFDPSEYEEEAQERWGDTDTYKESARRTARYTKQDWQRFKDENDEVNAAIADLIAEGVAPDDPRAMDAVDRARLLIDVWFYPCSRHMHAQLGMSYVADSRFTATYEKIHVGMAQFICDATAANAARGK